MGISDAKASVPSVNRIHDHPEHTPPTKLVRGHVTEHNQNAAESTNQAAVGLLMAEPFRPIFLKWASAVATSTGVSTLEIKVSASFILQVHVYPRVTYRPATKLLLRMFAYMENGRNLAKCGEINQPTMQLLLLLFNPQVASLAEPSRPIPPHRARHGGIDPREHPARLL